MPDDYAWHRAMLAGEKPQTYEGEPQCGYFKVRDRRGLYAKAAPIKRPFVAAAIFRDASGELKAEIAKSFVLMDRAWPYLARYPIPYETYAYWHQHERWPEQDVAA